MNGMNNNTVNTNQRRVPTKTVSHNVLYEKFNPSHYQQEYILKDNDI